MRPHCSSAWRSSVKKSRRKTFLFTSSRLQREAELRSRIYSTSNREALKAEAPIGVYQNSKAAFQVQVLRMRVGESFQRMSGHINAYFKQKEISGGPGGPDQADFKVFEPRNQRNQRPLMEKSFINQPEKSSPIQLFHMSSLATRFGESYSYVANHINSVFSKNPVQHISIEEQPSEDVLKNSRLRNKRVLNNQSITDDQNKAQETHINPHKISNLTNADLSCSWEEGYLHFAQRINRYFGAKMEDTFKESQANPNTHPVKDKQGFTVKSSPPLRPKSLFHISSLTTRFGESYAYMGSHVNRYFKGSAVLEEDVERDPYRGQSEARVSPKNESQSFIQRLLNPSVLPGIVGNYLGMTSSGANTAHTAPEHTLNTVVMRRKLAEQKTEQLLSRLKKTQTRSDITTCIQELNSHLILHPACKSIVWQEKVIVQMLKHRQLFSLDENLQEVIRETLALIGFVDPLKGRGIRVLSIDGGGTRGVVPLQVLKQLEAQTGKPVYQLFDYICGVSTGAVLAFSLALARISVEECEDMYQRFGSDVFRQNPFVGTVKMGWTHSYYNTETWETILREKLGDRLLITTARDQLSPKVSAVSAVVNWGTSPKPFIFRNYNHSPGRLSRYAGGSGYQLWQAVRASSAAPGYFQEFPLHNDIHQDGGLILNNPCALAVHESRLLWSDQPFQCVLSLGTGRYDTVRRGPATSTSLRAKITNLISSATDTEGVHTLLEDLLEPGVYFRLNPMLSAEVSLDESRPGALQQLQEDTSRYLDLNRDKLDRLGKVLGEERTALSKTWNWISEKGWELQQRWG